MHLQMSLFNFSEPILLNFLIYGMSGIVSDYIYYFQAKSIKYVNCNVQS